MIPRLKGLRTHSTLNTRIVVELPSKVCWIISFHFFGKNHMFLKVKCRKDRLKKISNPGDHIPGLRRNFPLKVWAFDKSTGFIPLKKCKMRRNDTPITIAYPSDTRLKEECALNISGVHLVTEFWIRERHSTGRDWALVTYVDSSVVRRSPCEICGSLSDPA